MVRTAASLLREQRRIMKVDCLQKLKENLENELFGAVSTQQSCSASKGEWGQFTVCSNAAQPAKDNRDN